MAVIFDPNCIFCKIGRKELSADILFENDAYVVFKDIQPKAPVHLLVATKNHISSIMEIQEKDKELIGGLILLAKKIAQDQGIAASGFKLVFNVGRGGGQVIDHLHLHLLGGWAVPAQKKVEV
ncbi:MAG: histidine triad nucleotide-binding protein [Parcubacteria group bacterium]|nr:histidine triad nucleotide-binding protein [Parcubacteria group bacterium]